MFSELESHIKELQYENDRLKKLAAWMDNENKRLSDAVQLAEIYVRQEKSSRANYINATNGALQAKKYLLSRLDEQSRELRKLREFAAQHCAQQGLNVFLIILIASLAFLVGVIWGMLYKTL
jgi:predicted RNase H-like nuclease (RuvC/YqgF family)